MNVTDRYNFNLLVQEPFVFFMRGEVASAHTPSQDMVAAFID